MKYLYPIKNLKVESWIKWWLYRKAKNSEGILSDLFSGTEISINNTLEKPFKVFNIKGNSVQNGEPSPENEVPILSSGENGSITERTVNKNLVIKNVKGYFTSTDKTHIKVDNQSESFVFYVVKGKTYTRSCNEPLNVSRIAQVNTLNIVNNTEITNYRENVGDTFVSDFTGYCIWYVDGHLNESIKESFMVEVGSTATPYVPHQEQTYTIPTQQPMRSIGDVRDEFVKVDGVWNEVHPIYRYIFTGNEAIGIQLSGTDNWYYSYSSGNKCNQDILPMSNMLLGKKIISSNTDEGIWVISNGQIRFRFGEEDTTENIKNLLRDKYNQGTPLYVDFVLATSQNLPCTAEQISILETMPKSYTEQTNIYSEDTTPAFVEAQTYIKKGE